MSRAHRWKVVRLPAELAERIEELASEMMASHVEGRSCLPNEFAEYIPAHFVIARAVDEFEERRARSRAKRPAKSGRAIVASCREDVSGASV